MNTNLNTEIPLPPPLPPKTKSKIVKCSRVRNLAKAIFDEDFHLYSTTEGLILSQIAPKNSVEMTAKQTDHIIRKSLGSPDKTPICYQLMPAPTNFNELAETLKLLATHYPRYQFGNDLAIYDSSSGRVPAETNTLTIREALTKWRKLLNSADLQLEKKENLILALDNLIQEYKPVQHVNFALIIETSREENGALLNEVKNYVRMKLPLIVSDNLQTIHRGAFNELLKQCDKYSFDKLILIVPKGMNPEHYGFRSRPSKYFYDSISSELHEMLLDDTRDYAFKRAIALHGHGLKDDTIGGISIVNFESLMQILENKNTSLMTISSCFAGGINSTKINPDGKRPFPVLLFSATEQESFGDGELDIFYRELDKALYKKDFPAARNFKARPLAIRTMGRLLKTIKRYCDNPLPNLETLFLPSPIPTLAKIASIPLWNGRVLDLKEAEKRSLEKTFNDIDLHREYYFFSDPISHLELEGCASKIGFVSRGGHSHHVIPSISLPNEKLEDLLERSFKDIYASKCYLIGELRCQYKGKVQWLKHVAIIKEVNPYRGSIIFKEEGQEGFTSIYYKGSSSFGETVVNFYEACLGIYRALNETTPRKEQMAQFSLNQQTEEVFYSALDRYFWSDNPPIEAKLLCWCFQPDSVGRNCKIQEIIKKISILPYKERQSVFLWLKSKYLNIPPEALSIIESSLRTPLLEATLNLDTALVLQTLANDPAQLDLKDSGGKTAWELILEQKQDDPRTFEIMRYFYQANSSRWEGEDGVEWLKRALIEENQPAVKFLIELGVAKNPPSKNSLIKLGLRYQNEFLCHYFFEQLAKADHPKQFLLTLEKQKESALALIEASRHTYTPFEPLNIPTLIQYFDQNEMITQFVDLFLDFDLNESEDRTLDNNRGLKTENVTLIEHVQKRKLYAESGWALSLYAKQFEKALLERVKSGNSDLLKKAWETYEMTEELFEIIVEDITKKKNCNAMHKLFIESCLHSSHPLIPSMLFICVKHVDSDIFSKELLNNLIKKGVDLEFFHGMEFSKHKRTVLSYAIMKGKEAYVRLFLEAGADKTAKTTRGLTFRQTAKNINPKDIIPILDQFEVP